MEDRSDDGDRGDAVTVDAESSAGSSRPSFRIADSVVAVTRGATRYEVGSEIARGGLGRVTAALDRTLQRQVAIKELHQRSEHGTRRFVREGLTTARLQHPAIVPVLDAGTWDSGDPYLVMKLLEGKTLSEELRERTSTAARLALVPNLLAVADALGYAHEQGVVHRDVKPSNIMLGTHGETVLLDWGIAVDPIRSPPHQSPGSASPPEVVAVAGTVRYMSPEQARGEPVDPRFDVYSLGATLAATLGGTTELDHTDPVSILERLRAGDLTLPKLPADIPVDLAAIVAKATAKVAAERYAHAGQVADDLRKFIAGQLVSARPYTRRALVSRWIRRHRVLLTIVGLAASAIVVIGVIAIRSVIHERNLAIAEREAAEAKERELILLQARANLRSDPTATIAWLKQYPTTAPHQDVVLELVDEAAGRGVARHVWRPPSRTQDVAFASGGLISAHQDGTLLRADGATGSQVRLAAFDRSLLFLRVRGAAVFVLDQDGGLHRWSAGGTQKFGTIPLPSRPTGMFWGSESDDLKVTFADDEAIFMSGSAPGAPHERAQRSADLDEAEFADDETNATAIYAVAPSGELVILDPLPRRLWKFAPRTWVRSSDDGKTYVAIEPTTAQSVTVWIGAATGGAPQQLATTRPCSPGESRQESGEITDDARFVALERCGVLQAYDVAAKRPILVDDPDRVGFFALSPDSRWLALGRSAAVELRDLQTGVTRTLAGGSRLSPANFSPAGDWFVSVGDQGTRLWSLAGVPSAVARLGDVATPTRLYVPAATGELALRQHLGCSSWRTTDRSRLASFGVRASAVDMLDEEPLLWAWDSTDDGHACIFTGANGSAIIATQDGATRSLTFASPLTGCVLDGTRAVCRAEDRSIVTFDLLGGAPPAARSLDGTPKAIVRYRGAPIVLVDRAGACSLEAADGHRLAGLPSGCRTLRASNASQLGREAGLVIGRSGAVDVWTDLAPVVTIRTESDLVEVSRERGLVAVGRDHAVEIWDVRTGQRRAGPSDHALAVTVLAWSSTGILASADAETVRLWDPSTDRTRVLYAEHVMSMAWSSDGRSLYTTDGRVFQDWPIDLVSGASPAEVRERLERLTSATIVDGRVVTIPR